MADLAPPEASLQSLRTRDGEADGAAPLSEAASEFLSPANQPDADSQPASKIALAADRSDSARLDAKAQICFDFTKGTCTRGEACKFSHSIQKIIEVNSQERGVCFDFLRQACSRGALCRFSHDLSNFETHDSQNSRARNSPICYDFVKKQCTRGAECRYSHDLESIVNSTRGRQISAIRHNPLASSSYSWAYAPPSIYQQQNMAMAAIAHPWGPQHSMLLASLPGVPGAIEAMAVPYGNFPAAAGACAAFAAPADMEALKAMATAAADPRNGHVVQAQILQQMQSMLSMMQQQQPGHHPTLPHRHRAIYPAVAAIAANSAYAESPSAAQAPAFPAANAARPFTNSSAWHSPALAGVARQMIAEATPQQTTSSLNVNAAVFMTESPSDGIGAYWNSHGARPGHRRSLHHPFAAAPAHEHPAEAGNTQAVAAAANAAAAAAAAAAKAHHMATDAGWDERQASVGAESITRIGDAADRPLERRTSALHGPAFAADHHEELVTDGEALRHSKESMLPLHNRMPGRRLSSEHAAVESNGGAAPCRTSMPELQLDLHARGELPAMRTASPEAFRRTLDASRRKQLSAAASLNDAGTALRHHHYDLAAPMGDSGHSILSTPPAALGEAPQGLRSSLRLSSDTAQHLGGLSSALPSPFKELEGQGGGALAVRPLPRHLSMDVSSMRHLGISGNSDPVAGRLGARHRQVSLGPSGVPAIAEEALDGDSPVGHGLSSLGHAASLSDGLQHLNMCQHIWRRT